MYYKLVKTTEFDANDPPYSSKAIICIIMAKNKAYTTNQFRKLAHYGVIHMSNTATVEESTEEEYYDYTKKIFAQEKFYLESQTSQ